MAGQMIEMGGGMGGGAEDSLWSQIGNFAGENKDLLFGAAAAYGKFEKEKAANRAQDYINQAASKWSGFNPSLMSLVKPVTAPSAIDSALTVAQEAPRTWYNLEQLYAARKAAQAGDTSKMEELKKKEMQDKALKGGLNG